MVERKYLDRPNWRRVLKRRFCFKPIDDKEFKGYIAAIYIDKTREPLTKKMLGKSYCLANDRYIWLECLPKEGNYCMTTMFNENLEIVQWYFDIIKGSGINERGIPYFDDLYLDVVVLPPNNILLLDEDELEEALDVNDITKEDYDLAYKEAERIMGSIDIKELTNLSNKYLKYIMSSIK